jgi:hypothetical protein
MRVSRKSARAVETHNVYFAATFLAPHSLRAATTHDQNAVGLDRDFGSFMDRHDLDQLVCPAPKS